MTATTQVIATGGSPETAELFKSAFRLHPSGVAVVAGTVDGVPAAMTISSLVSLSVEPPLLMFSMSRASYATQQLMQTDNLVVHFLGAESRWLAQLGAQGGADRFADPTQWSTLPTGEPVYSGVNAWLRVNVNVRISAGTAIVCICEVLGGEAVDPEKDQTPLVYHARTWHQLSPGSVIE